MTHTQQKYDIKFVFAFLMKWVVVVYLRYVVKRPGSQTSISFIFCILNLCQFEVKWHFESCQVLISGGGGRAGERGRVALWNLKSKFSIWLLKVPNLPTFNFGGEGGGVERGKGKVAVFGTQFWHAVSTGCFTVVSSRILIISTQSIRQFPTLSIPHSKTKRLK